MGEPRILNLSADAWEEIERHAIDCFPEECCGVIVHDGPADKVRRLRNIQNQLRALDPATYPRDATIAYAMDAIEFDNVVQEAERSGAKIKAFYHSHPDHEAYFSQEDKAFAMPFGEPIYPDTAQIVVSIYDRIVRRIAAYAWSEDKKDFVEIPVNRSGCL
ncbi:MAG: Mov34/MPN/PAD-1 family protein [Deltaproteobacteria bacterium]|nr:Mov34/MPN/PAD-1 family protein [Deltaproteobacteria bacterium]